MALPTDKEINAVINEIVENPGPRWHAMTFEQGVRAALEWIIDDGDNPLDND